MQQHGRYSFSGQLVVGGVGSFPNDGQPGRTVPVFLPPKKTKNIALGRPPDAGSWTPGVDAGSWGVHCIIVPPHCRSDTSLFHCIIPLGDGP